MINPLVMRMWEMFSSFLRHIYARSNSLSGYGLCACNTYTYLPCEVFAVQRHSVCLHVRDFFFHVPYSVTFYNE